MRIALTIVLFFILSSSYAQPVKLYNPDADVSVAISEGIIRAKAENKHILLQIGGNWCPWCLKFHKSSSFFEVSDFSGSLYGRQTLKVFVTGSKTLMVPPEFLMMVTTDGEMD